MHMPARTGALTISALLILVPFSAFAQLGVSVETAPASGIETGSVQANTGVSINTTTDTATVSAGGGSSVEVPLSLPSDATAPVISGVLEASLLASEATFVWSTDELAVSTFRYGTTMS